MKFKFGVSGVSDDGRRACMGFFEISITNNELVVTWDSSKFEIESGKWVPVIETMKVSLEEPKQYKRELINE